MSFQENLIRARKARGMTQEELAAKLNVSRQAVSKWETGESLPDLYKLAALADELGVSTDELCGREPAALCGEVPATAFAGDTAEREAFAEEIRRIAKQNRSLRYVVGILVLICGVLTMLAIQTFMIVAGVIKMVPLTGVTMPFLSYGGSSMLSCLMMIGVVHGICARAQEVTGPAPCARQL